MKTKYGEEKGTIVASLMLEYVQVKQLIDPIDQKNMPTLLPYNGSIQGPGNYTEDDIRHDISNKTLGILGHVLMRSKHQGFDSGLAVSIDSDIPIEYPIVPKSIRCPFYRRNFRLQDGVFIIELERYFLSKFFNEDSTAETYSRRPLQVKVHYNQGLYYTGSFS
ncbi:hypothetical protein FF38_00308 [Lucilia cuprina]|uniref:Uncharacterized protein n=1 Tax=Lucilia cuprina TaxID=7375 RepID=A0A0L0BNV7_LUCCU|nr:hypothetical protein FF38_00308 [Lucilia cuprina]